MRQDIQNRRYSKAEHLVTRRIGGEVIVVPVSRGAADLEFIYTANETGARIWECLDERKDVSQIIETICQEFDVPPEEAADDVIHFLSTLEQAGLIFSPEAGG